MVDGDARPDRCLAVVQVPDEGFNSGLLEKCDKPRRGENRDVATAKGDRGVHFSDREGCCTDVADLDLHMGQTVPLNPQVRAVKERRLE